MGFSLSSVSSSMVLNYVQSFGILAPVVAFVLFVIQAALPVFPYVILAGACGLLFGFKLGFFLSWSGALLGACLAYILSRRAGADWVEQKILSRRGLAMYHFDPGLAFWGILLARIIPVFPTPLINIVAGIGRVPFWSFFLSSALGKIPTAVLYTGLGVSLQPNQDIKSTAIIIALILLLGTAGHYLSRGRWQTVSKAQD